MEARLQGCRNGQSDGSGPSRPPRTARLLLNRRATSRHSHASGSSARGTLATQRRPEPANRHEFAARVSARLDAGADTPAELQAALRPHYPDVLVRARELSSEPATVWYIYRDGRWVP
jgi:hypothetical protein